MLMHVNARKMAFGGLMLALCVLFMALGSVFESSTLFLLACASFFEGIVIREMGMKTGLAFYLAAVILGFLLAPNKFYVISFAGMALYILAVEGVWRLLARRPGRWQGRGVFWCFKYLIFNAMYIPAVLLFQEVFFSRRISALLLAGVLLAGQAALWIYDHAYEYVQARIWPGIRGRMFRM